MSDEEDVVMSEEEEAEEEEATEEVEEKEEAEEEEEEEEESASEAEEEMEPSGPSEAELAMKRRREQQANKRSEDDTDAILEEARKEREREEEEIAALKEKRKKKVMEAHGELDDEAKELLAENAVEREKLGCEIEEMRKRSERRKKEREAEEKRLAAQRTEEEAQRKAAEEERRRKKEADELERKQAKLEKMAELERLKNPSRPNFVITKKDGPVTTEESSPTAAPKKSKEQLEAEKKAILKQRIPELDIDGADSGKLKSKANELHALIVRLESEKYDLEKRFKSQQLDMMELAEKARNVHKASGSEAIKRVQLGADEVDKVQEKFAGCPSKVIMFSEFERQMDKRTYGDKRHNFVGPVFAEPTAKIKATRQIQWDENTGLPTYIETEGGAQQAQEAGGEEE